LRPPPQVGNGAAGVPVGKLIAILAEEGDDLSSLEIPSKESTSASTASASSSTPATPSDAPTPSPATPSATPSAVHSSSHPHHDKPLLPSVLRLLVLNNIEDANVIKGTGHHGVLTKGDVLAYLGKISNPRGSLPEDKPHGNHPANYYTATPKDVSALPTAPLVVSTCITDTLLILPHSPLRGAGQETGRSPTRRSDDPSHDRHRSRNRRDSQARVPDRPDSLLL
jgi:pyruvate/2-oxoglutarate dehydrogenase complex dihydrolipoamide acyltransferase (E2) component